ncbi:MAG: beta-lactamase family protein, partial [Acidobacteria bacterium]|nr:beta-lactamase family protein [Acidobacteriota bacterium]
GQFLGGAYSLRQRLERQVPGRMEELHVPGLAPSVVDSTGPVLTLVYGTAEVSGTRPVEASTVFEAASLGKPLFAAAVLRYGGEPPLDLDRPLVEVLGRPPASDPAAAEITGRHCLSHSSGLTFSEEEDRRTVDFRPGSRWRYSGLGYAVLQQAVEALWGQPLDELARTSVTGTLGMGDSSYLPPAQLSRLAQGHDREGRPLPRSVWSAASAASSLHTTVGDYGRFLSLMLSQLAEGDGVAEEMIRPQVPVEEELGLFWGLGWAVAREGNETLFLHWGSNPGFKSLAVGSVDQGLAFIVLTNGDNGLELATSLVPMVLGRDYAFLDFFMLHPDD